ncbi:MAG TPA: CxxxxCH/CxxCH domain-containing protein [Polyangiaceae bacterium]|nr:CxxxxCH/CxxCH domain-containing protein [Polyangiaceae bacterium]
MAEPTARARSKASTWTLVLSLSLAFAWAAAGTSCLDPRESTAHDAAVQRCASCHGDPTRDGDYLDRSAPPLDLLGRTTPHDPGVGAHAIHLRASETHGAVPCRECHVVPDSVDAPGHADDPRPAEIDFGSLARRDDHAPRYDFATRSCRDSYCHGRAEPRWTAPKSEAEACGSCHGLPPPEPHPQSERCFVCHGQVLDRERHFIAPSRHVDGVVDYEPGDCVSCHGSSENAAPPADTTGTTAVSALGVGAHQAHLSGGSSGRPLSCTECHVVPAHLEDATHIDAPPAEVRFLGVASSHDHLPRWHRDSATCSDSWCHAPNPDDARAEPVWNSPTTLDCRGCHGAPPPAPHPQIDDCSKCHADTVASDNARIIDRTRHVDGKVDVSFDQSCGSCHGNAKNAAPPRSVIGETATSVLGIGAHQTHVLGTASSRAVPCETCHVVPKAVLDPGHVDTPLPAEVTFSGTALANGATPTYQSGRCSGTPCHGATFPKQHASGGSNTTPRWNVVDGSQAACGSCHGLPPPAPHPLPTFPCHSCHEDIGDDDQTFTHPGLHVDGKVTFAVP